LRLVLTGNNRAACLVLDLAVSLFGVEDVLAVAPAPGSGAAWHESLADRASAHGVQVFAPASINSTDAIERILRHRPELMLSVYYTQLFRRPLFEAVACPILNFHPSLLPRHRGTAPLIWAIVEGDDCTGVTVHHIDAGIDTGPIVLQRVLPIHPDDTGFELHQKAALLTRACAMELLRWLAVGGAIPQGRAQQGISTAHSSRDPQVNRVNWTDPTTRILNIVRALAPPLEGAHTFLADEQINLHRLTRPTQTPTSSRGRPPGFVERGPGDAALVWTADGFVELDTIAVQGRVLHRSDVWRMPGLAEGQLVG
jgi:methionyl-tRNA formyltransferase